MYCKNCGKEIKENIAFCNECGIKIEMLHSNNATEDLRQIHISSKKSKKIVSIIVSIVLAVAVIVTTVGLSINSANNTPERVAEKFVTAIHSGDAEEVVESVPDFMTRRISQELGIMGNANKKMLISLLQSQISASDMHLVTVLNVIRDYSFDVSEYTEELQDEYGATYSEMATLSDACAVKVTVLLDGSETQEIYVICIKLDKKWYALDMD